MFLKKFDGLCGIIQLFIELNNRVRNTTAVKGDLTQPTFIMSRANVFLGRGCASATVKDSGDPTHFGYVFQKTRNELGREAPLLDVLCVMNRRDLSETVKLFGSVSAADQWICLDGPIGNADFSYKIAPDGEWYVEPGNGLNQNEMLKPRASLTKLVTAIENNEERSVPEWANPN